MTFDIHSVKISASNRWPDLLSRLCGIPHELLDGRNHPCPKCGGKDRFRMIDAEAGSLYCNHCFNKDNGDGIAAIMWLTESTFPEAMQRLAAELGYVESTAPRDVVTEMAMRKRVLPEALRDFGAHQAKRGDTDVCRVPMYDASMTKVGDFDMAPGGDLDKGKAGKGSRLGLFVAAPPKPGETICLVEGVKDAAALHGLGIAAIGLPTCRMDARHSRLLRDCHVIVIPDRDKAGSEGAIETAARLLGVAATVKIAELPAEYRETGGADVRDVLHGRDGEAKVREAIQHARTWHPQDHAQREPQCTLLADAVDELLAETSEQQRFLCTGVPDLDYALGGGLLPGEMVIIAGRPSHGKTMVAMQALDGLSLQVPVCLMSEEMSVRAVAMRALAAISDTQPEQWIREQDTLRDDAKRYFAERKPYVILDACGNVKTAVESIGRVREQYGVEAVAVDYVQLLKGDGTSRYEQVTDVSMRLKQAAVANKVLLLAVCQLNRSVETRQGVTNIRKEKQTATLPRMSDLRDSGQLEQDADVILFVEWLRRTSPDLHREGEYRIVVAKNRNRPIVRGIIDCLFRPERQRLYPLARYEREEPTRYGEFEEFT